MVATFHASFGIPNSVLVQAQYLWFACAGWETVDLYQIHCLSSHVSDLFPQSDLAWNSAPNPKSGIPAVTEPSPVSGLEPDSVSTPVSFANPSSHAWLCLCLWCFHYVNFMSLLATVLVTALVILCQSQVLFRPHCQSQPLYPFLNVNPSFCWFSSISHLSVTSYSLCNFYYWSQHLFLP